MSRAFWIAVLGDGGWVTFVHVATIAFAVASLVRLLPGAAFRRGNAGGWVIAVCVLVVVGTVAWEGGQLVNARAAASRHPEMALAAQPRPPATQDLIGSDGKPRTAAGSYLGVYAPGEIGSNGPVDDFAAAVGAHPNVVLYYSDLNTPFQSLFANRMYSSGAIPLVQLNPGHVSMSEFAAGTADQKLRVFADEVKSYGHPVIIGFASEPDGNWYRWGYRHTPAATWVAAWRHVVTLFRQDGASNITWLWTMNASLGTATGPLKDWWPGGDYVDWVGLDGYYFHPDSTFASVFAPTIASVRAFTSKPVLLSETAIGPVSGADKIAGLIGGVRANHLLGLVWFDQAQHGNIFHQDWRLEDSAQAKAVFREAVATLPLARAAVRRG
jgi:hypothetical protein